MADRVADARWNGSLPEGNGTMRLGSGAYEGAFSFESRFGDGEGTNPEELIAAAHAGCYSMALSGNLGRAGYEPENVETTATVTIERAGDGFAITSIRLAARARVPGIGDDEFQSVAEKTKETCPVSLALAAVDTIEVEAETVS